jgi:hypothetical protein
MYRDKRDTVGIEHLLGVPELSASWRSKLEERLSDTVEGTNP